MADIEIFSPGELRRVKRYSRVRLALRAVETAVSVAGLAWFALSGRSARLRRGIDDSGAPPEARTPLYLGAFLAGSSVASLPMSYVRDLVVERRYGLTRQSTAGWAADQAKGSAVSLGLGVPLLWGAAVTIERRPRDWWWLLASGMAPVTVVFARLAPVLIMPLFNRFERLTDAELEGAILRLAKRAGVTVAAVYRIDMSRQTEKPNAFFTGLGGSKRIALADTLLDRFESAEIEGIIAHELAHQVHRDIWRFIAAGTAASYGLAFAVHRLAPRVIDRTRRRTGVASIGDVAALPLTALVASLCGNLAAPVIAGYSRSIERRADRYAVALTGDGPAFAGALRRLARTSLSDPSPPRLVVLMSHGHPPLAERVAAAMGRRSA